MENLQELLQALNKDAKEIFNIIQKNGPVSRNKLCEITGFKLTTLYRIIEVLKDRRLITEYGVGKSSGGRKPVLYDVNTDSYYVIGVDISRTYSEITVVNLKMKVLLKDRFEMKESCTPHKAVEIICKKISEGLNKLNIEPYMVLGVGLGAVGPLDREKGILINPVNFIAEGWNNVPVRDMLSEKLNLPVIIDNGANTAVLAEHLFGIGKGYKNIAYFNCGVGIRTGAISGDITLRTINDAEDCFAHMTIDVDGVKCNCGNYGCVEAYSSISSITIRFINEIKKGRFTEVEKPIEEINYLDICIAAENNDELAKEVISSAATSFGVALANYIDLLNPHVIILSGPLINHSNLFYKICKEIANKKHYLNGSNKILFSKGGFFQEEAISIGAAVMVVEKMMNNRITY